MSQVKVREYLVMTLYYTVHDQVSITMFCYIEDILNAFDKSDPKRKVEKSIAAPKDIFW